MAGAIVLLLYVAIKVNNRPYCIYKAFHCSLGVPSSPLFSYDRGLCCSFSASFISEYLSLFKNVMQILNNVSYYLVT